MVERLDTVPAPPGAVDESTIEDHPILMFSKPTQVIRTWYQRNLPAHGWTVRPAKAYEHALWIRRGHTRILLRFVRALLAPALTFTKVVFHFGNDLPPPRHRAGPTK